MHINVNTKIKLDRSYLAGNGWFFFIKITALELGLRRNNKTLFALYNLLIIYLPSSYSSFDQYVFKTTSQQL
jgi:hypothetical protein